MTEAQVLALIQSVIIANGNNEITANVLRPVLEALLSQPNDLIGDLNDLQTTANTNLVEAINEVLASSGSGLTILTGVTDPNITPPAVVSIGDFYIWDDGALQGFYQYNGVDFFLIKTLDIANDLISTDVGQQLTTGTDGKLFVNGNPIPIENVYDDINSATVGLLDNQVDQTSGFIQKVLDASSDPNVTIPPGGTTIRYYEKLDTNTASLSDYQLLDTEYYIIYEIQGETIINEIFNDSTAGTSSTYGSIIGLVDGINNEFKVSEGEYKSGSLRVFRNGKSQVLGSSEDFIELNPNDGSFRFNTAPLVDDIIDCFYVKENVGGNTIISEKNTVNVSTNYTALNTDRNINVDASLSEITITLPSLLGIDTIGLSIKKTDLTANKVIIVTPNSETIDGEATNEINTPFQSKSIITDEINYFIGKTYTPKYKAEISITQAEQLEGVLRSDVTYLIDGKIDLGSIEIIVPESGLFLKGHDYFVSGLFSTTDGHTMFKNGVGAYAGNFKCSDLFVTSSGVGSQIFNLDNQENFGAIEFSSVNLGDFSDTTTSLGELSNYRQFRTNDCGLFRNQDGLTFSGTWAGGFRINDTIVLAQLAGSTLFKPSAGLTFAGRCISDINAASVDGSTITFDFLPSNFLLNAGFQLAGASFAPNSSISVTMDETSIKAFFRDCVEIRNTRPGFEMTWTAETVTPLTLNTPTKALGTTVTSNETWFTQTGNNEVTYNSTLSKDFKLTITLVVDGGANDEISLHVERWDDSLGIYENIKTKTRLVNNLQGGVDLAFFNVTAIVNDLSENDRIEIWLENTTNNTDVTVNIDSEVIAEIL